MKKRGLWLAVISLLVAGLPFLPFAAADGPVPRLEFSHKIGTRQTGDAYHWMNFVAISADGSEIVSNGIVPGGKSGAFGRWKLPDGEFVGPVEFRISALSADFRYAALDDGAVVELKTGRTVLQSGKDVTGAVFSPSGAYFARCNSRTPGSTAHQQITIFRISDGSVVSTFPIRYTPSMAFHPADQILATGHWNQIVLWDVNSGKQTAPLPSPLPRVAHDNYERDGRYIKGVTFSPDGTRLAVGSDDGELQIWDVPARKLIHALNIGELEVSAPAFSPDGKLVAAGTYGDGTVTMVDVEIGKVASQIQVSMFGCGMVAFSPDGKYLVTPSNGGLLSNGRVDTGGTIRVFRVVR
jgi:hypothetical protein